MKLRSKLVASILLIIFSYSYGQMEAYNYKREIKGITEQWHTIMLPDEVFGKVSQHLTDIRIVGITSDKDTIEAPYILRLATETISSKEIAFNTLNASHNANGYYFTFEILTEEPINQINLEFKQQNFDWRIKLEGSHNQKEWYTVLENYRILSIKNEWTDYKFTKMTFPSSRYHFFRLLIESNEQPDLTVAKISRYEVLNGVLKNYPIKTINRKENRQTKQTEIDIDLYMPLPVSHIKIGISDTFDYYRSFTVKYLTDSVETIHGWKYNYSSLASGILNSLEGNEFKCSSTTTQKLKIHIHNHDNQPIKIHSIEINGYVHELVTRITEPATYYLTYGNSEAVKSEYDIVRFMDKIPERLVILELGDECLIDKLEPQSVEPLFKNNKWLWVIMIAIILTLGLFSIKMIRGN